MLDIVGLADRAGDRIGTFSLGMRQRLAVGAALLRSPELLILDEPANGLDPAGTRELRDLFRGLVAAGTTILLSSHILGEVRLICDQVTVIAGGPVTEVLAGKGTGGRSPTATSRPASARNDGRCRS